MIELLALHLPDQTGDYGVVGIAGWIVYRELMGLRKSGNPNHKIQELLEGQKEIKRALSAIATTLTIIKERLKR